MEKAHLEFLELYIEALHEWVQGYETEFELKLFQCLETEKMIKFCNGFCANND